MWQTVRKFWVEPSNCNLPTMLWNVSVMLRVLTLNIDSTYTKRIPIVFYILTGICIVVYYYVYMASMLWFIIVKSPETGNLVAAMVVLSLGVSSMIATMKTIFMLIDVKRIRRMVDEYLECDALTVPGSRFSRNLAKSLISVKRRAVFFWILIMCNGIAYVSTPVFLSGRHLMEDYYVIYGLEPMLESPNYELAWLMMGTSVMFICFITVNNTAFIIVIAGYTEAQMLSLSEELHNVWEDAIREYYITFDLEVVEIENLLKKCAIDFDHKAWVKINIEIKKLLVLLIQKHARNIHLLREVENIFRVSIAIGFVFLIIALIAELLGGIDNTYLQLPFTISQVAMDCWTGQKVMDASMTFERAVYACKWENFDRNNMKIVLVMLQSSQRTLTLSAGGVTMLSFSCLMLILRSVYSSYTTLRSMIKKQAK